jgi:hypothetical protein
MQYSFAVNAFFILRPAIRSRRLRAAWKVWSIAVLVVLVTLESGCGQGPSAAVATVKDPPPLAAEETTEALIKSMPKAKGRQVYKGQRR